MTAHADPIRETWPPSASQPTFVGLGGRALLALEALVVLGALALVAQLAWWSPQAARAGWGVLDPGWLTIGLAAAGVAGLTASLARRADAAGQQDVGRVCLTLTAMAGCVLIAVTVIQSTIMLRHPASVHEPELVHVGMPSTTAGAPDTARSAGAEPGPVAFEPDLTRGERLYGTSCAACHGGQGEGVSNVGPPVHAQTPWLSTQSDEQVVAFLQVGRAPGDPDSVMGRAMPARGGNFALTDDDLRHITAFLRTLSSAGGDDAVRPVSATPPRWVVAAPEPGGDVVLAPGERTPRWPREIVGVERDDVDLLDRRLAMAGVAMVIGVQGAHLAGLLLLTLGRLLGGADLRQAAVFSDRAVAVGWIALAGAHLALWLGWWIGA